MSGWNVPGFAGFKPTRTPLELELEARVAEMGARYLRRLGAALERAALRDWAEEWDLPLSALHVIATESQMPPMREMLRR